MILDNTEAFEFTSIAENDFYNIIENDDFFNQESEIIYNYLKSKMDRIHFCDYLKRFIFRRVHPGGRSRRDVDYREYIIDSFRENKVPSSMAETGTKLSAAVNNWLSQKCVTRDTIFLLGFGLKMTSNEVSEFLVNAIGDMDFDFKNPYEVIYWYCYRNELSYNDMKRITETYENLQGIEPTSKTNLYSTMEMKDYSLRIVNETELLTFLAAHKGTVQSETLYDVFETLYNEACGIIIDNINTENKNLNRKKLDSISSLDFERRIYMGVPIDAHGNLRSMTQSELCVLFGEKRFNRKRISDLKKRIKSPERFDIVTLCFIIAAEQTSSLSTNKEIKLNYYKFIKHTNETLAKCRFGSLYAANPYENFIMMCMMCQDPMLTFSDVWEYSYKPVIEITAENEFTKLNPEWQIVKPIGKGTFSKVYEISRNDLGHSFSSALKIIDVYDFAKEDHVLAQNIINSFANDIIIMQKLKGTPNIVNIEDYKIINIHEDEDLPALYIRMEMLKNLEYHAKRNTISENEVIRLGIEICSALELCEKHNIVHRDIKPENIFVSEMGAYKLGDFNISVSFDSVNHLSRIGTAKYMSPETYTNGVYNNLTDLYSLGIIMYSLLNNNCIPFLDEADAQNEDAVYSAIMRRMSHEPIPALKNCSSKLFDIISRAVKNAGYSAYTSALDMRSDLKILLD